MKTIGLVLLFVMLLVRLQGQEVMENNPPSVKWFQLTTPHFNVLYPEGFDPQAQRMANTLEHIHKPAASTLGSQPKHFSIILQNRSSFSNAFVTITPRRAEFYTMPTQNYNFAGTVDWLDLTAIHEYRHIVQFEHANQGFNRIMYYLLGNHTLSTLANAAVPDWFWEGDAVTTETALTTSGRGRIPEFGLVFRTNLQEGRIFNYHKQFLRSYKHNIPDHYVLGYHMVSYLRKKTNDPLIWSKVTERAWRSSIVPFTFSNALKKETGMSVTKLYQTMAADLKKEWDASIDTTVLTAFNNVNFRRRTNTYTDYLYPQVLNDSTVLVTKKGIGDIDQLVILKGPYDEEKVFVQGLVNETGMLSVGGSRVAWNEYRFDPRWRVRNYSVVKVLDLNTREKKTLVSSKTKFAGAALSPDGTKVITVETDLNYHHSLVLIDVEADVIIKKFDNPDNHFYSMPRWSANGTEIVVLKTTPQGKAVMVLNAATGDEQDILPVSDENIGYPVLYGDYLLYNSPISGRDNIYAFDRKTKKKYQVTYSRYGSYNPSVSKEGKYLYYNEQTRNGLDVVNTKFDPSLWRLVEENRTHAPQLADYVSAQTGRQHILDSVPAEQFPMKKYTRAKGLVNPYSWGLYFNNTLAQAEIGVISKDVLSTTSINGGYQFDLFERTGIWRAGVSYQGFYPILDLNMTYGQREDDTGVLGRDVKLSWTETGVSTGFRVPLLLTRSKYLSELTFSNHVGLTMTSGFESRTTSGDSVLIVGNDRYIRANDSLFFLFTDRTDFGQLIFNNASISFSHSLKQSPRDFNPRFAQFLVAEHYGTPFGGDFSGWLWNVRGHLYFPGLVRHHSLFFRGAYQDSYNGIELDTYTFRNRIFKPRGYSYPRNATFYTLSANYAFPVWYPDIAIGPLVNIQRVRANLFYDYGEGQGRSFFYDFSNERQYFVSNNDVYTSFGGELTFDINLFRLLPQFEVGVRASGIKANRFNNGGWVFELLIGNINF